MELQKEEREIRQEAREHEFKKGLDAGTERRVEETVKIRKEKRQQYLKRVRRGVEGQQQQQQQSMPVFTEDQAKAIMVGLQTGTRENRSGALRALRALTASDEPHLRVLHGMHVVQVLQKVLTGSHGEDCIDALWCLTNLASGSHETTVPLFPVLPYVVQLLESPDVAVADQAAWCIGNIAGDCAECRVRVVQAGAVVPMVKLMRNDGPPSLLVTLGFTICNMIRQGGALGDFVRHGVLPLVLRFITPVQDPDVLVEMTWLLTFLSAGEDAIKAAIVSMGGVDLCLQICASAKHGGNPALMVPLMRALGNLCSAPDPVVMRMLKSQNFLLAFWSRLGVPDTSILKEVCWALTNLSGGPVEACAALVQCNFIPPLAALLNTGPMGVRKEVGFVFLNLVSALRDGTPILEMLCATPGVVSSFVEFMSMPDVDMIDQGLRWASYMLRYHPRGKAVFEENCGLNALEDIEYNNHKNDKLFDKANRLLDKYFSGPEDGDIAELILEQEAAAAAASKQGFHF